MKQIIFYKSSDTIPFAVILCQRLEIEEDTQSISYGTVVLFYDDSMIKITEFSYFLEYEFNEDGCKLLRSYCIDVSCSSDGD